MSLARVFLLAVLFACVSAHIRFIDPAPRTTIAEKNYPCGPTTFFNGGDPVTTLAPGIVQLHWEEYINHDGAPFRLALSVGNDNGYDEFILIDHLPHMDKDGLVQYYFNVTIPNINCPQCGLQLMNPMTDKIGGGACCSYPETSDIEKSKCFSVYHSCANIVITGTQDPAEYLRQHKNPPTYPYRRESTQWISRGGLSYELSESSTYETTLNPVKCSGDTGSASVARSSFALILLGILALFQ